ncbi:hypothetical protein V1515DRAFT_583215 [Lipomyces mesembrius]
MQRRLRKREYYNDQATDVVTIEIIKRVEIAAMDKAWQMSDLALAWILEKTISETEADRGCKWQISNARGD